MPSTTDTMPLSSCTPVPSKDRPVPFIDALLAHIGWGLFYRTGSPARYDAWTDRNGSRTWQLGRLELVRDPGAWGAPRAVEG